MNLHLYSRAGWLALCLLLAACGATKTEGKWVNDIKFRGNHNAGAGGIKSGLETQETGWWPCAKKQWFDPVALQADRARIETYYAARGFFEAQVRKAMVKKVKKGKAVNIEMQIDEGPETKVTSVKVEGLERLSAEDQEQARSDLGLEVGQRFDHAHYLTARRTLRENLKHNGFAYAETTGVVRVDRKKRQAEVVLRAKTGPLVRLGQCKVSGHGDVPAFKIQNLAAWKAGDRFDSEKIDRTRQRITALRVFSEIRAELPAEPVEVADVEIKVAPAKRHELRVGGGVGLESRYQEVRLSGTWTLRNFYGGLRTLEVTLKPAIIFLPAFWQIDRFGPGLESEVRLTNPDTNGTKITLWAKLGFDLGIDDGWRYYGPKVQLGAERPFYDLDLLRVGLTWDMELFGFYDIVQGAFDPETLFGDSPYLPAWVTVYATLDLRDDLLEPRAGFWASLRVEQGGPWFGSRFSYVRIAPDVRGYIPLGTKRLVLALRGTFGWLYPFSPADSPVTRRFRMGGPTNHRGFSLQRLSPQVEIPPTNPDDRSRQVAVGGNLALLLSADLRLQVVKLLGYWFSIVAFVDAGDVVDDPSRPDTPSKLDFTNLHVAVGGGLLYNTPMGAIRFSVGARVNRTDDVKSPSGEPINPDPGEWGAWHLAIGGAF